MTPSCQPHPRAADLRRRARRILDRHDSRGGSPRLTMILCQILIVTFAVALYLAALGICMAVSLLLDPVASVAIPGGSAPVSVQMLVDVGAYVLLILPFALRPAAPAAAAITGDADTLVIVTPHTEQIRYEFEHAFRRHYQKKFNRDVILDWRNVGGTSDIVRYIADRFEAVFRQEYEQSGGKWTPETARNFKDPKSKSPERAAFLAMEKGIGIDVFFGGGSYDQNKFAQNGMAIPGGVEQRHPEWFTDDVFPRFHSGEQLRAENGGYYGVCLSSFGLAYNPDRFRDLNLPPPKNWRDLADPRLFRQTEVADPTKSGSVTKCYEMIIQQAMLQHDPDLAKGWEEGFLTVKLITLRLFPDIPDDREKYRPARWTRADVPARPVRPPQNGKNRSRVSSV